jgi:hypothetical protein
MSLSPYTIWAMPGAGPALTAAANASMLSAAAAGQSKPVLQANWLQAGTILEFDAWGTLTTAATPGSGTWQLNIGSAIQVSSGALVLAASATAWPWHMNVKMQCRSLGQTTAAQLWVQGYLDDPTSLTAWSHLPLPQAAVALGAGFDSTVANYVDALWTQTLATGSFTCNFATLIAYNPNF